MFSALLGRLPCIVRDIIMYHLRQQLVVSHPFGFSTAIRRWNNSHAGEKTMHVPPRVKSVFSPAAVVYSSIYVE